MAIYGAFASPIAGMLAQSNAFGAISQNITNMNTGGYKAANTRFSTVLASTFGQNKDIGGVLPLNKNYIEQQGRVISTNNPLDLAINGKGMFVLNTEVDGSGETIYTRDGGFSTKRNGTTTKTVSYDDGTSQTYTVDKGYLVDKNGYYVQAWEPDATGQFTTSSSLTSIRIDDDAFDSEAAATTSTFIAANLPAESDTGDEHVTRASAYTDDGTLKTFELVWTRQSTTQTWNMHVRSDLDGDSTVDSASTTPASSSAVTLSFGSDGHLPADSSETIAITYTDGKTLSFDLDINDVTSLGSSFQYFRFDKDGRGPGTLSSFHFDDAGQIVGNFTNGVERALYKLPLATFVNADGLEVRQGNLFSESVTSGEAVLRQVKDPAVVVTGANQEKHEYATFIPSSHELSNTNLEQEFSLMIITQQAYNSSATVFKTLDEMTKTASELKV